MRRGSGSAIDRPPLVSAAWIPTIFLRNHERRSRVYFAASARRSGAQRTPAPLKVDGLTERERKELLAELNSGLDLPGVEQEPQVDDGSTI